MCVLDNLPEWDSLKHKWVEYQCQWSAMSIRRCVRATMDVQFPMSKRPSANWTIQCKCQSKHVQSATEWTSALCRWCWPMPSDPMRQSTAHLSYTTFAFDHIYRAHNCTTVHRTGMRLHLLTLRIEKKKKIEFHNRYNDTDWETVRERWSLFVIRAFYHLLSFR